MVSSQLVSLKISNQGETFDIAPFGSKGAVRLKGSRGFGVADTQVKITDSPLGGGKHRSTRRRQRRLQIPIAIFGENTSLVEASMRALARILRDDNSVATLLCKYPDGREVWTPVRYGGGLDPQWGEDSDHRTFAKFVLTLVSEDPYWTSIKPQNYSLGNSGSGRGLIRAASLVNLQISPTSAIGTFTLINDGDVDAFPVWTLRGPATSFYAVRRLDGARLQYNGAVTTSNPLIIDTKAKTVKDSLGANKYTLLSTAPKFFSIPPGETVLDLQVDGTTSATLLSFYFHPRFELVFS